MNIEFIDIESPGRGFLDPIPATKKIPGWFKSLPPLRTFYKDASPDFTIKKCIPVLDALTTGYYLKTNDDIYYEWNESSQTSEFKFSQKVLDKTDKIITMHPFEQIRGIELMEEYHEYAYKWTNPYVIKTPPGYSCIFTHPFNQVSSFLTLTGVVDTDMHPLAVQFPFVMKKSFSGKIDKDTPIVQIIPFKRDDWKMLITSKPSKLDIQEHSEGMENFDLSRYEQNGLPSGGEYKKKHRKKKKFI